MAEENAVVTTEMVNEVVDIADNQLDAFFENGGELPEAKQETPEPAKEVQEEEKEPEKEKFVPYGALHEERQRRKELQQEIERIRQEQLQSAQVMQQVLQQMRQQQEPPAPTVDDDPVAYFQAKQREQEEQLRMVAENLQQRQEREQQEYQQQQFVSAYRQAASEFSQKTPDFNDAYKFAIDHRANELRAAGYPAEMIPQILRSNEAEIVSLAFQQGINPAEKIYEIARIRGWKGAPQAEPEQKMQTLEKGVKASKPTGGAPQGGEVTLEALAEASSEMDAKEFNDLWAKFARSQR